MTQEQAQASEEAMEMNAEDVVRNIVLMAFANLSDPLVSEQGTAQIEALIRERTREALERASALCEALGSGNIEKGCASAIRRLIGEGE